MAVLQFQSRRLNCSFLPGILIDMREFPLDIRKQLKELSSQTKDKGMNMFALDGDKVIYNGLGSGTFDGNMANPEMYLKKGEICTVTTTFLNDSRSYVMLNEALGEWFNQIYFSDFINK